MTGRAASAVTPGPGGVRRPIWPSRVLPPDSSPLKCTSQQHSGRDPKAGAGWQSEAAPPGPAPCHPRPTPGPGSEAKPPTFAVNLAILVGQGGRLEAFATLGTSEAGLMPGLGGKGAVSATSSVKGDPAPSPSPSPTEGQPREAQDAPAVCPAAAAGGTRPGRWGEQPRATRHLTTSSSGRTASGCTTKGGPGAGRPTGIRVRARARAGPALTGGTVTTSHPTRRL